MGESDVDSEGRKSLQVAKQARQAEKKVQEVEATLAEEKKATAAAGADGAKLAEIIKELRLSLETAEMKNNGLNTKNSRLLAELEAADVRPLKSLSKRPVKRSRQCPASRREQAKRQQVE